ncbi:MAG: hypothetical protein KAS94_07500, partial [Desulfobulbaceae bacterium]|nr:hypothetical protein [Desulfobulbaceae bacterium]
NTDSGGSDSDIMLVAANGAVFITDALAVGGNVALMAMDDGAGSDITVVTVAVEPNYHFGSGTVVPYAGAHLGIMAFDYGSGSETEVSFGPHGGLKSFLSENTALDTQLRFTTSSSADTLELRVGLNIYF